MSDACKTDPCKAEACLIQDCLRTWNYNESKCTKVIDTLYACCTNFYKEQGVEARSVCCPTPALLDLKVRQRKMETIDAELLHHRK